MAMVVHVMLKKTRFKDVDQLESIGMANIEAMGRERVDSNAPILSASLANNKELCIKIKRLTET